MVRPLPGHQKRWADCRNGELSRRMIRNATRWTAMARWNEAFLSASAWYYRASEIADDGSGLMCATSSLSVSSSLALCLVGGPCPRLAANEYRLLFGFHHGDRADGGRAGLHGRDLMLSGVQRLLTRVKRLKAAIRELFALIDALLSAHSFKRSLVLCLGLLARISIFVLGFDNRLRRKVSAWRFASSTTV